MPRQSSTETVFRGPSSDQNFSYVVDVAGSGALVEMLILGRSCGRIGCLIKRRRLEPNR